jgi:uncharacterized membrane protein
MTAALRVALAALGTQLLLQLAWHAWLEPTSRAALALATLPLVPGLWIAAHDLRRGVLIGGIVSLFYFCHGVAGVWDAGLARWLAIGEIGLCLIVIGFLYADVRSARKASAAAR